MSSVTNTLGYRTLRAYWGSEHPPPSVNPRPRKLISPSTPCVAQHPPGVLLEPRLVSCAGCTTQGMHFTFKNIGGEALKSKSWDGSSSVAHSFDRQFPSIHRSKNPRPMAILSFMNPL